MSALACLTEFPGTIENIFVQREFNPRGKYQMKLFDIEKKRWTTVTVDDRIPCKNGKPVFANPNGDGERRAIEASEPFERPLRQGATTMRL